MDEAAVIRKIAALLARAEDGASSPAEVAHAVHIADKLMRRYNLDRTDVRLRQEKMRRSERGISPNDSDYANTIAVAIGHLAQCRTSGERGRDQHFYIFSGLRVDVDYAEWLFRASWGALRQGWDSYRTSRQYAQLIEDGATAAAIERHYKFGFSSDLADRLKGLAKRNAIETGTSLIALKHDLIAQAFGPAAGTSVRWEVVRADLQAAYRSGADAAKQVRLRQSIGGRPPVHKPAP